MAKRHFSFDVWWPGVPGNWRTWLPSRGNVLFTIVMIGLLIAAQSAGALPLGRPQATPLAAATSTIAYQGRLADADGNPLTDTVNMIFRLYDVPTGGTPLWEEQWTGSNGVRVSDGLFNVMLGSLTPIPQAVITGNNNLFLGITAGTDDEMQPRVQLGSVPFAVQALTIPDGSVTTAKIADGAVTQAKLSSDVSLIPSTDSITTTMIADGAVTAPKLSLPDGFTVRQGSSEYKTTIQGRMISMQDGSAFPGKTHLNTFWNNLYIYTDVGAVNIGGQNGEKEDLNVTGNFSANGTKSSVVGTLKFGRRKLYAVEAPDVRFSDEGMAQLHNGSARVELDPIFLETIEGDYLVHVTAYGAASLYVAEIGSNYFVVKSLAGDSNVSFAWRISAPRKGYGSVRLEKSN